MNSPIELDHDLYDRVVGLVAQKTGHRRERIKPESRLFHDLGVDGIDGDNLLAAIRDEFSVDVSTIVLDKHFGPEEPFNPFKWVYWLLCERSKLNAQGTALKKIPITVTDLYEAAKTKKFPDLSNRIAE